MRIQDMFEKDINRSINGVVKVAQDDDASIRSELEEYVITRELRKHFSTLLERYDAAIDTPTDKIGVWISGFFGSGKSHFLKMLSYLLSNREVAGKHAIDYFDGKFDDPPHGRASPALRERAMRVHPLQHRQQGPGQQGQDGHPQGVRPRVLRAPGLLW